MQPWLSEADDNDTVVRPDHLRRRLVQGGPVPSWLKGRRRRAWPGQQIIFTVCECCSGAYRGRTRGPVAAQRAPTYSRVQTRLFQVQDAGSFHLVAGPPCAGTCLSAHM